MNLVRRKDVDDMTPPDWLINGVLPARNLSMLYGDPKKGKSLCALDMACCVATGHQWAGKRIKRGPVVYVAAEGSDTYQERLYAWEKANGKRANHLILIEEPVLLYNGGASVDALLGGLLAEEVPPVLVVFDTLSACAFGSGAETNDGRTEQAAALGRIIREAKVAALVVHHTPKDGTKTPRGGGALTNACSMVAYFTGDGKTYGELVCQAERRAPNFGTIKRTLAMVTLKKDASPVPAFTSEPQLTVVKSKGAARVARYRERHKVAA